MYTGGAGGRGENLDNRSLRRGAKVGSMSSFFISLDSTADAGAEAGISRVDVEGGRRERDESKGGGGRDHNVKAVTSLAKAEVDGTR